MRRIRIIAGALLASASLLATAASERLVLPPVLQELSKKLDMPVKEKFDAGHGLTGWVAQQSDKTEPTILYTTSDGKALVVGVMFGENGELLTQGHMQKYAPTDELNPFWEKLATAPAVMQKPAVTKKSEIFVFFDPNCGFCTLAYKALQPYQAAGVQISWIPVAVIQEDSVGKAAAIMQAPQPADALKKHQAGYRAGGLAAVQPTRATLDALRSNLELMQALQISGTPAIAYKDGMGRVQLKTGMPRLSELQELTGVKNVTVTDPELLRFQ